VLKARPRWTDPRRGMGRGLPAGLAKGLLTFRVGEGMADSRHPAIEP
jgi:hypothetical protein